MFKPVNAKTVEEYMDALVPERREILEKLDTLIKKAAPSLKQNFIYNMPGYGAFDYTDYKKREMKWPIIAVASQKNYVSVYVCAVEGGEYVSEKYKDQLGKVSVGKSCIRFKKLEDVDLKILEKVIKYAAQHPGFVQ